MVPRSPSAPFLSFLAVRFSLMDFTAFFRVGLLADFSDIVLPNGPERCDDPFPTSTRPPSIAAERCPSLPQLGHDLPRAHVPRGEAVGRAYSKSPQPRRFPSRPRGTAEDPGVGGVASGGLGAP